MDEVSVGGTTSLVDSGVLGRRGLGSRVLDTRGDRSHRLLVRIELATGGSALLCGGLLALRPNGSLIGLPSSVLEQGPFVDWRLPGLLLAGLVGLGFLIAGVWEQRRQPGSRELSMFAGAGLILFEAVEWVWLGFHPLQAIFMGVGATVLGLAARA